MPTPLEIDCYYLSGMTHGISLAEHAPTMAMEQVNGAPGAVTQFVPPADYPVDFSEQVSSGATNVMDAPEQMDGAELGGVQEKMGEGVQPAQNSPSIGANTGTQQDAEAIAMQRPTFRITLTFLTELCDFYHLDSKFVLSFNAIYAISHVLMPSS